MKKINKLAAATLISTFGLFSAGSAIAADYTAGPSGHWYVEGLVGGALPLKRDVTVNGAPGTYKPQGGFTGAATVGHTFGDNLRVELAGSWTRANKGTVVLAGTPFPHAGSIDVYTLMVNGLVSFDIGSVVRPFVGVGAGFVDVTYNVRNQSAYSDTGDATNVTLTAPFPSVLVNAGSQPLNTDAADAASVGTQSSPARDVRGRLRGASAVGCAVCGR